MLQSKINKERDAYGIDGTTSSHHGICSFGSYYTSLCMAVQFRVVQLAALRSLDQEDPGPSPVSDVTFFFHYDVRIGTKSMRFLVDLNLNDTTFFVMFRDVRDVCNVKVKSSGRVDEENGSHKTYVP